MMKLVLAVFLLGHAVHAVAVKSKAAGTFSAPISPPLTDKASDKKFFGPGGDYHQDSRPVPQKAILDKLKGPGQPYPALQSKSDFDTDYVKDENSDTGAWKAQFEYDALRKKLAQAQGDEKAAEARAGKEAKDVDDAQRKADEAAKNADDAKGSEESDKLADDKEDDAAPPSAEELEKLKKKLAEAEAAYEKEKKDFEECKRQLEESQKAVEELKAQQEEMEKQLAGETKLWVETKSVKLNLKHAKQVAASAKREAAQARLKVAQNAKAEVDKVLAREKAQNEVAQKNLRKEKADLDQAKKDLEKATLRLQKLKGYSPADKAPVKSGAAGMTSALSVLAFAAVATLL